MEPQLPEKYQRQDLKKKKKTPVFRLHLNSQWAKLTVNEWNENFKTDHCSL